MLPISVYISFFQDYFSTDFIDVGIIIGISVIVACFAGFKSSKTAKEKSRFLISMTITSTSLWIFVLSSLAFCMMFTDLYWNDPLSAVILVAKLGLATSLVLGVTAMSLLYRRALFGIYQTIRSQTVSVQYKIESSDNFKTSMRLSNTLQNLKSRIVQSPRSNSIQPILLRKGSGLPASLAFDSGNSKLIAIKEDVVNMLDEDELEGVMAHELGHIVQRDSLRKFVATAYKIAFPFDILTRLVEAALYREQELAADEFSARITRKPISLASALLKIYESAHVAPLANVSQISYLLRNVEGKKSRRVSLFSKEPPIELRIRRLINLESS